MMRESRSSVNTHKQERVRAMLRVISFLLIFFGVTLIVPLLVSAIANDGLFLSFALSSALLIVIGAIEYVQMRGFQPEHLRARDGFLIVAIIWVTLSLLAAVPMLIANALGDMHISAVDIIFESVSGLTTTGATTLVGLDHMPVSFLFYRQWLQWLGGIGVVVLAVSIMPALGVGGAQIYKAEAPGPFKDERIAPKISATAKLLIMIYVLLTMICGLVYFWAGMSPFDAMMYSLTTIATGGYAPHDASVGYFDSYVLKFWITIFMMLGGISFALHYTVLFKQQKLLYFRDEETRFYIKLIAGFSLICAIFLMVRLDYDFFEALVDASFHVVSFMTSTGYTAVDLSTWPVFLEVFLFLIAAIGGCQGSSAGGIKVVRIMLFFKQGYREMRRIIHPQGVFLIRLNGRSISETLLGAIVGFFALYVLVFIVFMLLFLMLDHDFITAFAMAASSLNNTGPGIGEISSNYLEIDAPTKLLNAFAMVLGRLELFTLLVLVSPRYWRQ